MHKSFFALSMLLPMLASTAHAAEISLRPGLWEVTTTSDLLLLVPHIPADQMRSIKDLANDYGLEMPQIENGAAISSTCITQEMVNQKSPPVFAENQLGCTTKNSTRTGNNYKMDFICDSADLKGNGTAEGVITSAENFSGQTKFNGLAQGNAVNEQAEVTGKWVNASCGTVKPSQ